MTEQPQKPSGVDSEIKERWIAMQEELKDQVILHDTEEWGQDLRQLKFVAGMDISYPEEAIGKSEAVACLVIVSYPDLATVYQATENICLTEPYIPGFLAFRESGPLLNLLEDLLQKRPDLKPDVILIDGNGILHPRRYGCACHIGLKSGIPTIGVAKNIYKMDCIEYNKQANDLANVGDNILLNDGELTLGMALKTAKNAKNPVTNSFC
ncbi:unnamed protein product [Allacma fusca]|uniref:Endonuclease V n=1 Tax=Allacma fusca TaxID=39272 RepID=A0A8J2L833_9HEXA|nr:unnamed protein product [Allacma fusca]